MIGELIQAIEAEGRAVLVLIAEARGSAPREAGAAMVVTLARSLGTVGGGTVEHRAIEVARGMLDVGEGSFTGPLPNPPPGGGRG